MVGNLYHLGRQRIVGKCLIVIVDWELIRYTVKACAMCAHCRQLVEYDRFFGKITTAISGLVWNLSRVEDRLMNYVLNRELFSKNIS